MIARRALEVTVGALVLACTRPVNPTPTVAAIPVWGPDSVTPRSAPKSSAPPAGSPGRGVVIGAPVRDVGDTIIRVLLSSNTGSVGVGSPAGFVFTDRSGAFVARAGRSERWRIERDAGTGRRVRAVRPDGVPTVWVDPPLIARPIGGALINVEDGKPYRGDVWMYGGDSGVMVVNVLRIDDYLRGVVPLEIGTRASADSAAVQAQAVTARSYAYIHLEPDPARIYDVTGGTLDQVYGGVAAETPVASEAVESTRTLVLKYNGRIVNAPYHSTCGGETAAASEIWHTADEPYLQSVSDRIPGTDRSYCDIAPLFRWTRTLNGEALTAAVARYLANYASGVRGHPGTVLEVGVASRTPSGRVGTVTITTTRGNFVVRGNDTRFVLRTPGGEILNSTYFSLETSAALDGSLARLVIHGKGYGHGVGMCQWGAIGRARAGQDFRTILHAYYPGTTVAPPT